MNNLIKDKFEFCYNDKITLYFVKAKEKNYYDIIFIKNKCRLNESAGWHYLNYYFKMNPFRQEIQHSLYEIVKYKVFNHQSCYSEQQTKQIIDWLESLRVMKKLVG